MLDTLRAARARVSEIDAKIRALECSLSALGAERLLAQAPLDAYSYPVLTLPPEITCEIFKHFLPPYPACPPIAGTLSPIALTHICRRWREIALSTPDLWSRMQVSSNDSAVAAQVDAWLTRSGSRPLCIESAGELHGLHLRLLSALIPHCARWGHLKLRFSESSPAIATLPTTYSPFPLLRHLDVALPLQDWSTSFSFVNAPLLRTVAFNHTAAANIPVPWGQITTLTLSLMHLAECVPVFTQASRLVHCRLSLCAGGERGPFPAFRLPALETLVLRNSLQMPVPVTSLIDVAFVVPALRTLELSASLLGTAPTDALRAFVSRRDCTRTLRRLCIFGGIPVGVNEDQFREEFPEIEDISFCDVLMPF
ncbi:hypothetical protein C8R46DRAFT_1272869 [Mycena filopes]|nr:hypothetical protein C8R46DRAFT_1272869 [Mycena filopes]